jgi:hypothetical protein
MYGPLFDLITIGQRRLNVNSPPSQVFVKIHLIEIIHLSQKGAYFLKYNIRLQGRAHFWGTCSKGTQLFLACHYSHKRGCIFKTQDRLQK